MSAPDKQRDENAVAHSDRVHEACVLVRDAQKGRLIGANLSGLCLLSFMFKLCAPRDERGLQRRGLCTVSKVRKLRLGPGRVRS